jgi:hypothetical protein
MHTCQPQALESQLELVERNRLAAVDVHVDKRVHRAVENGLLKFSQVSAELYPLHVSSKDRQRLWDESDICHNFIET